jgi:hypothetical protein
MKKYFAFVMLVLSLVFSVVEAYGQDEQSLFNLLEERMAGFTGKKKETLEDGSVYEGEFFNGKPHGRGTITYPDGSFKKGEWRGDKFNGVLFPAPNRLIPATGKGKLKSKDGAVYEGDIVNGKPHGKGKMTYPDGKVEEGEWEDGKFLGNKE